MRANYRLQRLFVPVPLAAGGRVTVDPAQAHYLRNVLRLAAGAELLLFNGVDGEWRAIVAAVERKSVTLSLVEATRPQPAPAELLFAFAPIKAGRLDWLVQRATEMGAGHIQPVITKHCQVHDVGLDRLRANVTEAAEQCGVLAVPVVHPPLKLERFLAELDRARHLVFCDEDAPDDNPLPALRPLAGRKLAVLVGPEGGFAEDERNLLRRHANVTAIPLGPRILRADTAAIAALAVVQAAAGDWTTSSGPGT